jgi:hypothetical protein
MRLCSICKTEKPVEQFNWKNKKAGLRQYRCRECQHDYSRAYYDANSDAQIKRVAKQNKRYAEETSKLKEIPCADCGKSYPYYVMDYDHLENKAGEIAVLRRQGKTKKMLEEIAKCEVVCSNCHRERTYQRQQSRKT